MGVTETAPSLQLRLACSAVTKTPKYSHVAAEQSDYHTSIIRVSPVSSEDRAT